MSPIRLVIALVVAFAFAPTRVFTPVDEAAVKLSTSAPAALAPVPNPAMTPDQVVDAQLVALRFNDRPSKDAGIATTFRFASPTNRKVTGPLERFSLLVRSPAYSPLINHRAAHHGPLFVRGELAVMRVKVIAADGREIEYEFRLTKDPESGCWFTDGVFPILPKPAFDPGKLARSSQVSPRSSSASLLQPLQPVLSSESG